MTNSGDSTVGRGGAGILTIAHRAANDTTTLRAALDTDVDLIEADVRLFRGTPEVRHLKALGPRLLWHPGDVVPRRSAAIPTLTDLLAEVGENRHRLLLDLKGFRPALAPAVAEVLSEHAPDTTITVSTPHWWMFKAFAELPKVRPVLSAGSWPMVERLRELLRKGQPSWPNQRPIFGCAVHRTLLTRQLVTEMRYHVEHVFTWPVDTAEHLAEAHDLEVTGVVSKDLSLLKSLRPSR
ncbi:glycerophosphodiester phosphodiesterase [Actinobacteria bacterium YIM 96077]|uniref:Glycerophosphodiester phosphodiesterase n=1 Tax=Phytoactinopolyspora halophila TaxID=1981511 RepID=A0A329QPJ3_9ACTN|nr:glycerophosphodiester phosphodiesterase [Phytoactinopolyspora halophila]AYY14537.1 glycerophosphodiester phosphodiesterase [Actinobacteria bacterium YIM 96077]RAW14086.1 glycerophosphodiester phosphodiesterase [Phytoactinopolyspora halophila]